MKICQCKNVVNATFEKQKPLKIFVLCIFIRLITYKTLFKQSDYGKKEDNLVLHCNLFNVTKTKTIKNICFVYFHKVNNI